MGTAICRLQARWEVVSGLAKSRCRLAPVRNKSSNWDDWEKWSPDSSDLLNWTAGYRHPRFDSEEGVAPFQGPEARRALFFGRVLLTSLGMRPWFRNKRAHGEFGAFRS